LKAKQEEEAAAALLKKREEEEAEARRLKEEAEAKKAAIEIPSPFNNKMDPSKDVKGVLLPAIQSSIYYSNFFQAQVTGQGCGRFALNNLFHCEKFTFTFSKTPTYEKTITLEEANDVYIGFNKSKQINLAAVCELNSLIFLRDTQTTLDPTLICKANEDFPVHVIMTALNITGHSIESYTEDDVKADIPNSTTKANLLGYIINYGKDHYVALRKLPNGPYKGKYRYYDSLGGTHNFKTYSTTAEYVKEARANDKKLINILEVSTVVPEGYIRPTQLSGTKTFEGVAELKEAIREKYRDDYKYELNNLDFAIELGKAFTYFTYDEDANRVFSILFGAQSEELLALLKDKEVQTDITKIIVQRRHALPKILLYLGKKGIDIMGMDILEAQEIAANANYAEEVPGEHYTKQQQLLAAKEKHEKEKEIQETLAAKPASATSKKAAPPVTAAATATSKKAAPPVTEDSNYNSNDDAPTGPQQYTASFLKSAQDEEAAEQNNENENENEEEEENENSNENSNENEDENENENENTVPEPKKPSPPKGRPLQESTPRASGRTATPLVPIRRGEASGQSSIATAAAKAKAEANAKAKAEANAKAKAAAKAKAEANAKAKAEAEVAAKAAKANAAASTVGTVPKPPVSGATGKPPSGIKKLGSAKKSALNE